MNWNKNLHWFVYAIFAFSCARQSSPTGGPKDTIPPVLVRAIPRNEAINFKEKEIELVFSEAVILNAPKEQLIITPTISKDYKIVNRKNSIILTFEDPLRDSTTYTFNFREAVQDITEKNPVENLQIAYSTGTYIDSLYIEGTIHDMLKGKEIKDATVALHVENDTFNILEHPAVYFTKTDDKGRFKISHLKPDNYFIYALEDKNRNLIVNSRSESYGFKSELQYLFENIKGVSIGLVRLDAGPLKMTSARPYNTYFNIRTSKNLRTFKLTATDSANITYTFGEDQANIRLYKTTEKDSIQIHLLAIDSIDNALDTTLYAKFLSREVTPESFDMRIQSSSIIAHKGELLATLSFTKPVKEINPDSIFFQVDSLRQINFSKADFTWDPLLKQLTIQKKIDRKIYDTDESMAQQRFASRRPVNQQPEPQETKKKPFINELTLGQGAFISIENDSSKRAEQKIKPLGVQELSIINVEIKTAEKFYIVELINNTFKVFQQVRNTPKVRFEDVVPGEYQIRLIIDSNQNGRWDAGNYFQNEQPEQVIYYRAADGSTTIKGVKANWDIGAGEMFITY
jgi:hypothetical protein